MHHSKHVKRDFSSFSPCEVAFDSVQPGGMRKKRPNSSAFQRPFGAYFSHFANNSGREPSTAALLALPPSPCIRLNYRPCLVWNFFIHPLEKFTCIFLSSGNFLFSSCRSFCTKAWITVPLMAICFAFLLRIHRYRASFNCGPRDFR